MSASSSFQPRSLALGRFTNWGVFWLLVAVLGAGLFFQEGIAALLQAWKLPEYSHGPLIPILSGFLFLKQLKGYPERRGAVPDRWPGLLLLALALAMALAGRLLEIPDLVTYGLILWVGALLLVSFGWKTGRHFWPPVLHLVYMLPLPGAVYYGLSTYLQGVSSELGVYFLQVMTVPVFLEGNIIDLGVYKLHVAEACSGLRYLFPIMSFSYVFAVLYRGPMWHKAVLLLSAAPITVLMNSVRIGIAGWIVNHWGLEWVEGFSHFFEGWVIFISCVLILFALAWLMLRLQPGRPRLVDALDLETDGLGTQLARIRLIQPSLAMITLAASTLVLASVWAAIPQRGFVEVPREPFSVFPTQLGDWSAGPRKSLDPEVEAILRADDYHSVLLTAPGVEAPVDLFFAWYEDQMEGGVHSPEVCLPGGGWEIAEIKAERTAPMEIDGTTIAPFDYNRVIIQQGTERMLVYYWFDQQGVRTASEFTAKMALLKGKITNGRNDSGLIRLITPIDPRAGGVVAADARLTEVMGEVLRPMPRFFVPPARM